MSKRGRHQKPSRGGVRSLAALTGMSAALSIPVFASPASAHSTTRAAAVRVTPAVSTTPAVIAGATLRTGSRGEAVAGLQRTLGITADGKFGPQTRGAVVAFQSGRGLVADGIVGPRTWAALGGATAAPAAAPVAAPQIDRASRGGARSSSLGASAVAEASRHRGKPYVYGAAGPGSFDCSGFTQYVYGRLGVALPHNAAAQYASLPHVAKAQVAIGDLVFIQTSGRISHVGIYAGDNTMWVARRTGTTITQQTLWTQDFLVARVA